MTSLSASGGLDRPGLSAFSAWKNKPVDKAPHSGKSRDNQCRLKFLLSLLGKYLQKNEWGILSSGPVQYIFNGVRSKFTAQLLVLNILDINPTPYQRLLKTRIARCDQIKISTEKPFAQIPFAVGSLVGIQNSSIQLKNDYVRRPLGLNDYLGHWYNNRYIYHDDSVRYNWLLASPKHLFASCDSQDFLSSHSMPQCARTGPE